MEGESLYPRLRAYYKTIIPLFEKPKVAAYTMLVLSFFTLSIFGTFALRPTLATIAQLRKKIEDQKIVDARMVDKINQLRVAQAELQAVQADIGAIFEALPATPKTGALLGKLNRTLIEHNLDVTVLQILPVALSAPQVSATGATAIGFTLTARASYEDIAGFIDLLSKMDRIVTIDAVDISLPSSADAFTTNTLVLSVRGKAYVLWEDAPAGKAGRRGEGG